MDIFSTIFVLFAVYVAYKVGQYTTEYRMGNATIKEVVDRAKIPVGIIDKIDGHYYIFDKETNDFLCQSPTLEELPKMLYEYKKISLALLMYPEEENEKRYWCINGKLKAAK